MVIERLGGMGKGSRGHALVLNVPNTKECQTNHLGNGVRLGVATTQWQPHRGRCLSSPFPPKKKKKKPNKQTNQQKQSEGCWYINVHKNKTSYNQNYLYKLPLPELLNCIMRWRNKDQLEFEKFDFMIFVVPVVLFSKVSIKLWNLKSTKRNS